jgi:hypothetical protein
MCGDATVQHGISAKNGFEAMQAQKSQAISHLQERPSRSEVVGLASLPDSNAITLGF